MVEANLTVVLMCDNNEVAAARYKELLPGSLEKNLQLLNLMALIKGCCGHSSPFGSFLSIFFFKLLAMVYLAKMDLLHFYPVRVDHGESFLLLEPRGER